MAQNGEEAEKRQKKKAQFQITCLTCTRIEKYRANQAAIEIRTILNQNW